MKSLTIVVFSLFISTFSRAVTITVLNTNDSGAGSLRNAISIASGGDIIDMTALSGTITLTTGHIDINSGQDITINGPGSSVLTIDCNFNSRAFNIYDADVVINNLRIINGMTTDNNGGGAIRAIFGSDLSISYCRIENCETSQNFNSRGGGIDVISYDPATWTENGTVTVNISHTQIENCRAYIGGGLRFVGWTQSCSISVNNSTIKNCSTGAYGTVTSGNDGGGMEIVPKQNGNPAGGMVSFTNCTFSGNSTNGMFNARSGGGLSLGTGIYDINSCTFANNSTPTDGGGIAFWGSGSCSVTNTILATNTGASGVNISGSFISGGFNLIGDDGTGNGFTAGTDLNNTNPMLSPLANNGGIGETHAIDCSSPAIDAGGSNPVLDQRELPRICDPDIGAFEYQTACNCAPLPVELVYFTAESMENRIRLEWLTSSELNNDYFLIERSQDGLEWTFVTKVNGAGTTQEEQVYEAFDDQPYTGISYYRLIQFDMDGQKSAEIIKAIELGENTQSAMNIHTLSDQSGIIVEVQSSCSCNASLEMLDITGKKIRQSRFELVPGINHMALSITELRKGTYYIRLHSREMPNVTPVRFVVY